MSVRVRDARLSVRVPAALKDQVRNSVEQLQARGVWRASESELVEMLVAEGLDASVDELEARLRQWRLAPTQGSDQ